MNYRSVIKSAFLAATLSVAAPAVLAWAETPQSGGTLHLAAPYGAALKSLDPHVTYNSQDMAVSKAFHRSLYSWDSAKNAPALDLAESVTTSEDGKTYTYKLFDNIYFHNGRKLTADDVIWSYTRIMDPSKAIRVPYRSAHLSAHRNFLREKPKRSAASRRLMTIHSL